MIEDNKELLIYTEETPHCKVHGAMMLLNGYWRCYGTYSGRERSHIKFVERTCPCTIKEKEWNDPFDEVRE